MFEHPITLSPDETLEYRGARSAWIAPDGKFFDVDHWGHDKWATAHGYDSATLRAMGWVPVSHGSPRDVLVTQAQCDTIWDWYVANDLEDWFVVPEVK